MKRLDPNKYSDFFTGYTELRVKYPISETMVAGNLKEMLKTVKHISKERVNNGDSITPWITFSGIAIPGK